MTLNECSKSSGQKWRFLLVFGKVKKMSCSTHLHLWCAVSAEQLAPIVWPKLGLRAAPLVSIPGHGSAADPWPSALKLTLSLSSAPGKAEGETETEKSNREREKTERYKKDRWNERSESNSRLNTFQCKYNRQSYFLAKFYWRFAPNLKTVLHLFRHTGH